MSVFRVGSNKSSVNNFPSVRPTLDLDFANSKTLDPRITFTRASGGSYTGADGLIKLAGVNQARFDHDPVTGESLGLLVEESRTNLVLRSEEFDNAARWGNPASGSTITANAITAPDGTLSADLVSNVGQVISLLQQDVAIPASSTTDYYATIYAKKGTSSYFTFNVYYNFNVEYNVDYFFDTQVVSNAPTSDYFMEDVGNGWYRCGFRIPRDTAGIATLIPFRMWQSGRGLTSGNTYFWGAQLEAGAFPTSYIPTVASTRTRAADNARITGKNFSEWYQQSLGTILCVAKYTENNNTNQTAWSMYNSTIAPLGAIRQMMQPSSGTNRAIMQVEYPPPIYPVSMENGTSIDRKRLVKVACAFRTDDYAISMSGTSPSLDSTGTMSNHNILYLGQVLPNIWMINGTIARITYYPKRLPDAQLQALTK